MNKWIIFHLLIIGLLLTSCCGRMRNVTSLDDIKEIPQKTAWVRILDGLSDEDVLALKRAKGIGLLEIDSSTITNKGYKNLASIASELPNWTSLYIYDQGANVTDDAIMFISQISQLKELCLYNCSGFTDKACEYLAGMHIKELTIVNCAGFNDNGFNNLYKNISIDTIRMNNLAQLNDDSVAIFAAMPSLKSFRMFDCRNITDKALEKIAHSTNIECLELKGCFGITNNGFSNLKTSESIKMLWICEDVGPAASIESIKAQVKYDNTTLKHMLAIPNLEELIIGKMDFLDNKSMELIAKSDLKKICFGNELPFDQNSLKVLCQSQSLEYLDFYFNESVSIETLRALPELKSLRRLYIRGLTKEGLRLLKEISAEMPLCVINDLDSWKGYFPL